MRIVEWGKTEAPEPMRQIFDFDLSVLDGLPQKKWAASKLEAAQIGG